MSLDLGGKLRRFREAKGFSQRELARRAGISNATISQIESNTISPSVGALKRILDALPLPLSDFFASDSPEPEQVFFKVSDMVEIGRGGVSYRQVGKDLTGKALQILAERYDEGSDSGRIRIRHEGEEGGIILRGLLEVTVGDRKSVLGPGEAYYFKSMEPHRFRNVGNGVCEVISVCTPPSF
ncbi:helix-turn-helix domain-containing protein [Oryzibacter oryziterrae]|uniref:helix-turn-helix domain-containing protein n=1 Tax=Oryzibacter oryziterrae TaxID=2766474 RepID=UPI001F1A748A|nr:helix-turn-helix domain-containing protein [Oryzibacter oryziterrae]